MQSKNANIVETSTILGDNPFCGKYWHMRGVCFRSQILKLMMLTSSGGLEDCAPIRGLKHKTFALS
jgi:hypothetical protein